MKKSLVILAVCAFLLVGCGGDGVNENLETAETPKVELTAADFYDGNHKRSAEYAAAFKTKSVDLDGVELHFAANVFDEASSPDAAEDIAAYFAAAAALAPELASEAEVYIVSLTTTDGTVLFGNRLYITPEAMEGEKWPAYVAACIYGETEWWRSMGLGLAALGEPVDGASLASRLEAYMDAHGGSGILSLNPCYFISAFADGETRTLARDIAQSIAEYAVGENAAADFIGGEQLTDAWLESIGLDHDLGHMDSAAAEFVRSMRYYEFGEFDMMLEAENFVFCVDAVDWLGDAETCYAFLLDFAGQWNSFCARLESEAPTYWQWLQENEVSATVNFRDSDYPISSRASMLTTAVVVTDDADVLHEVCHILMPRHSGDEAWWLCEGLVTYLTAPYVPYHADSIVVDSLLEDYDGDTAEDIALRAEAQRCFALL
ncbi:MAG: hypothetical protein IJY96_08430, partial [Oscillospiraceae bacterium]|nr:hypothetical protein [Oscillospiraceae bacterium]